MRRFTDPAYQPLTATLAEVRALADKHNRGFSALPDVTEAAYRALVAAFIANEQSYFAQTEALEP